MLSTVPPGFFKCLGFGAGTAKLLSLRNLKVILGLRLSDIWSCKRELGNKILLKKDFSSISLLIWKLRVLGVLAQIHMGWPVMPGIMCSVLICSSLMSVCWLAVKLSVSLTFDKRQRRGLHSTNILNVCLNFAGSKDFS